MRNTSQQLRDTALATWLQWMEDGKVGRWVKTDNTFHIEHGDIRAEVLFRALDTDDDVRRLLSLELTAAWVNEAREIPWSIIEGIDGRVGRYPVRDPLDLQESLQQWMQMAERSFDDIVKSTGLERALLERALDGGGFGPGDPDPWERAIAKAMRADGMQRDGRPWQQYDLWGARYPHTGMDTNPPDDSHWWFSIFETGVPPGADPEDLSEGESRQIRRKFKQYVFPPGLVRDHERGVWKTNPDAENLQHLKANYYADLAIGKSRDWVKVYCLGQYGVVFDGKLVYTDYDDDRQCVEFDVDPALPVYAGWDYSFTGQALVLAQLSPRGQLRVFQEYYSDGSGLEQFVQELKPHLMSSYGKLTFERSWGDPSGGSRQANTGANAIDLLNDVYEGQVLGLPFLTEPCWTNSWPTRRNSVEHFLYRNVGGKSAFLLHPRCDRLRKGFLGRYHLRKLRTVHGGFKEEPDKNEYSHTQDALGYIATGILGTSSGEEQTPAKPRKVVGSVWSGY